MKMLQDYRASTVIFIGIFSQCGNQFPWNIFINRLGLKYASTSDRLVTKCKIRMEKVYKLTPVSATESSPATAQLSR